MSVIIHYSNMAATKPEVTKQFRIFYFKQVNLCYYASQVQYFKSKQPENADISVVRLEAIFTAVSILLKSSNTTELVQCSATKPKVYH